MNKLIRITIVLITIAVSVIFSTAYTKKAPVFYGDALGYYVYLPAVFIYDNFTTISQAPEEGLGNIFYNPDAGLKTPKGYTIIQYTYGVALMEAPFFLLAHAYEKAAGLPGNGYSDTYKVAIQISSIVYSLLGMWILFLVLKRYFNTTVSILAISFIFIGTNLFWFSLFQAGMSHVPLFFLYSLLIYLTILLHREGSAKLFILTGLVVAFITLIRPSDLTCLLIPLLYNMYNRSTFIAKVHFLKTNFKKILLVIPIAALPFIPQIIYWKYISGSYFFDSYKGQGFNWTEPKIIEGLFSAHNGWLAYSPIMAFALIGFFLFGKIKKWAWCLYISFPLYIYVIYSWYCYNYINGLGSRPMIHLYPLLAIPLAAFIVYISKRGLVVKSLFAMFSLLFIFMNISYSMKGAEGKIMSAESNFQFNLQTMFKKDINYRDMVVADISDYQPDTDKIERMVVLGCEDYTDSTSVEHERDTTEENDFVYHLPEGVEYQDKPLSVPYNKNLFANAKWIKCTGRFMCPSHWGGGPQQLLVLEVKRGDQFLDWNGCQINNKVALEENSSLHLSSFQLDKWGEVYFFIRVPEGLREGDEINVRVWNMPKRQLYTDYYCIELYK